MVLGKKAAIFDWEWGRNSAPNDGQKIPWNVEKSNLLHAVSIFLQISIAEQTGLSITWSESPETGFSAMEAQILGQC